MINNEFDDYFSLLGNDYDDNIIELYPFAEAFGTPDMFRPDKSRRYDEEELENMSVQNVMTKESDVLKKEIRLGKGIFSCTISRSLVSMHQEIV